MEEKTQVLVWLAVVPAAVALLFFYLALDAFIDSKTATGGNVPVWAGRPADAEVVDQRWADAEEYRSHCREKALDFFLWGAGLTIVSVIGFHAFRKESQP